MPRTPDSRDGPLYEEAIIWAEQASDPTEDLKQAYVQGKGLVIREQGVVHAVGEGPDAYNQPPVDDRAIDTPPGSPSIGDRVIVGSSPTGDFVGHAGEIAQWSGSAWTFTTPKQGMIVYVKDEGEPYKQTSSATPWVWGKVDTPSSLPAATALGQILISTDGATFSVKSPLVSGNGGILTNKNGHIVVQG